jgi:membrane protease YdiL (CAAX protease family)
MTDRDILAKPARAAFSYWATLAWAFVAFVAGQAAGTAVLMWWLRGGLYALLAAPYDGATVTLSVLAINPVMVGVLMLAVRLRGAGQIEYLALVRPRMRAVTTGIVGIVAIIALTDALLFAIGHAIVSPFQVVAYTSAAAEGWLPLLWVATVLVAPAGEEITFRGFLFRGFVHADRPMWSIINVRWILLAVGIGVLIETLGHTNLGLYLRSHIILTLYFIGIAVIIVVIAIDFILSRASDFCGLSRPDFAAWRAIVFISLLWAGLHLQYDWTGIAEIFVAGLFLGWARWRSGSTLLTFLLHALFNLEGMTETVLQVRHPF